MKSRTAATDTALIAVFAALICAFAIVPPIPIAGSVPITLQTLAVALTGLILGPIRGFLATVLYILVGLAGLPVFAGGASGVGIFSKASAGYLISFPLACLATGLVARWALRRMTSTTARFGLLVVAALVGSFLVTHPMGIAGMYRILHAAKGLSLTKVATIDLAFVPGDIVKDVVAAAIACAVHKAFPSLLATRR
ncbi:MAG: biotin transporter BioY [Propionibacteriaceae bacterium]